MATDNKCKYRLFKRRGLQCLAVNCRRHSAEDTLMPAYGPGPFTPESLCRDPNFKHIARRIFTIRDLGIREKCTFQQALGEFLDLHTQTPVNDTDIFTLEPIENLEPGKVFTYKDPNGCVYAFDAEQLDYSVRVLGPTNPYTREEIPDDDLIRLRTMIINGEVPRKSTPDPVNLWQTPADAYTYVLHYYELYGFRCNVEWFIALSYNDIMTIFWYYHTHIRANSQFMSVDDINGEPGGYHFILAREMLIMINAREHSMQMYHLCNLIIAISQVCQPMRMTIPQWVYNAAGI